MIKKVVCTGILAVSLMAMGGVVGAENNSNVQEDHYTTGFVKMFNKIKDRNYGTEIPGSNGNGQYSSGGNIVSTANNIDGSWNSGNQQMNNSHVGDLTAGNTIRGISNFGNGQVAIAGNQSSVKNGIDGKDNQGNTQLIGWESHAPALYDGPPTDEGVLTASKAKNVIDSRVYGPSILLYDAGIDGIYANSGNRQNSNASSSAYVGNGIYGKHNSGNGQAVINVDTIVQNRGVIRGVGNNSNNQFANSSAEQFVGNGIGGKRNYENEQITSGDTIVSGQNRVLGIGNSGNLQVLNNSAETEITNTIRGKGNSGNTQSSSAYNSVQSSNSISSWDGNHVE